MNTDVMKGKWLQLKGEVRRQWGKLTDDDLEQAKGQLDRLMGKIHEHYGEGKDVVSKKIDALIDKL